MDVKIALAQALREGRRAQGYHLCTRCGGYHLGQPKPEKKCWATAKRSFNTEDEAKEQLAARQRKGRDEANFYQCKYCKKYHLTSIPKGVKV
jgi:hypothetical protein